MEKWVRLVGFVLLFLTLCTVGIAFRVVSAQATPNEIVLYAADAPVVAGALYRVADATAAGGFRLWNLDAGAAKLTEAWSNPYTYFEMTFTASAGVPYRLWLRGKAELDSPYNDSVFVQFSDSVDVGNNATYRIGTSSSTVVNVEDCSGCGLSGWGWQDNGWGVGVLGPVVFFQNSGTHTLRIQPREDGLSIDQIVLSAQNYLNNAPGALRNDTTILSRTTTYLPPPTIITLTPPSGSGGTSVTIGGSNFVAGATVSFGGAAASNVSVTGNTTLTATTPAHAAGAVAVTVTNPDGQTATLVDGFTYTNSTPPPSGEVVLYAASATVRLGNYQVVADSSAAGGSRMWNPDAGAGKLSDALPNPSTYFEMTFTAQAGTAYRLWLRGKADNDSPYNDSVFVQFSDSVDSSSTAQYRIGTATATVVNLEDCSACGLSGWGWQDNGWGIGVMGPLIYFQTSGTHTVRIQPREDGLSIDQVVLSAQSYLNSSPGALRNDSAVLPPMGGGSPPPPPANLPPVVSITASVTSGTAPLYVFFNSSASDPDGYIAAYNWAFGDGGTADQASSPHTYTSAGTYTARLTVTDNLGATAGATVTISVSNAGATSLRIITWNSQGGDGTDGVHDLDRQAAFLAARNPDVVAMCEVYQFSGGEDQGQVLADRLTRRTGTTWNYYWVPKFPGCEEGNLILTKWQVLGTSFRYLSYERSVGQMTINVNGRVINFFATHLDYQDSSYRSQEVTELQSFMAGFAEPRFAAGDFNAGPDLPEIARMVSSYYDSWSEAMNAGAASAYSDNPVQWMTRTRRGRLDYVFYSRSAGNVSLMNTAIPDVRDLSRTPSQYVGTLDDLGVRPSDHNMMISTFRLN